MLCEAQGRDRPLRAAPAFRVYRAGKMLVPIIDDPHLMRSDRHLCF